MANEFSPAFGQGFTSYAGPQVLTCLKGYVGIKGCGAPAPPVTPEGEEPAFSGLYVNQLPGVKLKMINQSVSSDQETFLGVWNDVEQRTLLKFLAAAKSLINKCFKITDSAVIDCLICENKKLFAVALWYALGVDLLIEVTSSDRLNRWTTIDRQRAEDIKEQLSIEYESSIKDAVGSINPCDSDCVDCTPPRTGPVRYVEQTP